MRHALDIEQRLLARNTFKLLVFRSLLTLLPSPPLSSPVQGKEKTRVNVFVETNEISEAFKLVDVHGRLMGKPLYKYFALRFSLIVSFFSDSSVDSSRKLRTMTLEKVPGGINEEHRGFLLQRLIESKRSLQTSKTTLKDYGESKL